MKCPACRVELNRLSGADGYAVDVVPVPPTNRQTVEVRKASVIYACPRCEHVQEGIA